MGEGRGEGEFFCFGHLNLFRNSNFVLRIFTFKMMDQYD